MGDDFWKHINVYARVVNEVSTQILQELPKPLSKNMEDYD